MKDPCAIFSGPIQMTDQGGEWTQEVLGTLLARILLSSSTTQTTWEWLLEPINWWWMGTQQLIIRTYQLYSRLQTIATDVETRLQLWMLTRIYAKIISNTILLQEKETKWKRKGFPIISYDRDYF